MSATAQALSALERANEIRAKRAWFKQLLRNRETAASAALDVLLETPVYAETWRVADFLACLPSWGPARASRVLRRCLIDKGARIGKLTARQRRALRAEIAAWNTTRAA